MVRRVTTLALAVGLAVAAAGRASASPVQWRAKGGGNDHFYNVVGVTKGISWPDASAPPPPPPCSDEVISEVGTAD